MTETDDPAVSAAGEAAPASDPPAGAAGDTGWRDGLAPDELSFASQFETPADAVRAALDLRRKLSVSVPLPDPDGDPDGRLALLDRLGRPETADGYEISPPGDLPDWIAPDDPDFQAAQRSFLEAMHGAGATQDMVDAALGWYWGHVAETDAERMRRADDDYADAEAGLRREWGRDFDANVEHANRAVAAFGGDDLGETLERFGLASHPAVVRAFARIGRKMGEDDMVSGRLGDHSRARLKERAEALVAEDDYWTNEAAQREMREIMLALYGDAEIGPGT